MASSSRSLPDSVKYVFYGGGRQVGGYKCILFLCGLEFSRRRLLKKTKL